MNHDSDAGGKAMEAKIENEARLKAKIEELERRLKVAETAVAAADATRTQLLAEVAHRLRTPLAGLTLWIKLLEAESDPARWREGLDAIRTCAEEQHKLLDRLVASENDFPP